MYQIMNENTNEFFNTILRINPPQIFNFYPYNSTVRIMRLTT